MAPTRARFPFFLAALLALAVVHCGGNFRPVASNGETTVTEDQGGDLLLTAQDDDGDPLTWSVVAQPRFGSLTGTPPELRYFPDPDFYGKDLFSFKVNDGQADSNIGVFRITVSPTSDPPVALSRTVTTDEDRPVTFLLHGYDPDDDPVEFSMVQPTQHGVLETSALPRVTYTPDADFNGVDSLTFQVSDGVLTSAVTTLTIEVLAVPDTPIALPQSIETPEDTPVEIVLAGSDPDSGQPGLFVLTPPIRGELRAVSWPTVIYTPRTDYAGIDSFTFVATNDEHTSRPATIDITVTAVNDLPQISDVALVATEDNPLDFDLPVMDPDSPVASLEFTLLSLPRNGRLHESPQEGAITAADLPLLLADPILRYVPPANYYSPGRPPVAETFDIRILDGDIEVEGSIYLVVLEGGIIYVSPDGDDLRNGRSPELAMRTIRRALDRLDIVAPTEKPDTIHLASGRYCESDIEIGNHVVISGAGMDEVVIDGSGVDGNCTGVPADLGVGSLLERCEARTWKAWPDRGIFRITGGTDEPLNIRITDLTISRGFNLTAGGAIHSTEVLNLERVRLRDNCSMTFGGALANERPSGLPTSAEPTEWADMLLTSCEILDNGAFRGGGLSNNGSVGLTSTTLTGNEAFVLGGAIYSVGGGVEAPADVVSLRGGTMVQMNRSFRHGGGLYLDRSRLVILDSSIIGNTAGAMISDGMGGGIYATGESEQWISIVQSFINRNDAPYCGGICSDGFNLQIGATQINDNHARFAYGGGRFLGSISPETSVEIFGGTEIGGNDSDGNHAGLMLDTVDVSMIQTIVRDNVASRRGGGISTQDSRLLIEDADFYNNEAEIGGGLLVEGASLVELDTVTLSGNGATLRGGAIAQTNGATYLLRTTTVTGNFARPLNPESDSKPQQGGGIAATGGAIYVDGATITDNEAADWGGGIFAESAQVEITNNALIGSNRAVSPPGDRNFLDEALPSGGGVYMQLADLVVDSATIAGNRAEVSGGGVYCKSSTFFISGAIISENSAQATADSGAGQLVQRGGGVYLDGTDFLIVDSAFRDNYTTNHGAGMFIQAGEGGFVRSEISGNSASIGDDPMGDALPEGGGLYVSAARIHLINSTLSGNWADRDGGAILGYDSDIDLFYVTVYGNGSGNKGALADSDTDWVFHAVVVAANAPGGNCDGVLPVSAFSLDSDYSCSLGALDLIQTDPMLDPTLTDNGGPTMTHAVLAGSPLIDGVPEEECLFQLDEFEVPHTDQRSQGFNRPVGVGCDVGAYERQ